MLDSQENLLNHILCTEKWEPQKGVLQTKFINLLATDLIAGCFAPLSTAWWDVPNCSTLSTASSKIHSCIPERLHIENWISIFWY